jgi:hypothetical protein
MIIAEPYPAELLQIARKVVWYDSPEQTLREVNTSLVHLMVYGSPEDVAVAERHISQEEFRKALESAPAGVFADEAWIRWQKSFGMMPVPPLPQRCLPDGSTGSEPVISLVDDSRFSLPSFSSEGRGLLNSATKRVCTFKCT